MIEVGQRIFLRDGTGMSPRFRRWTVVSIFANKTEKGHPLGDWCDLNAINPKTRRVDSCGCPVEYAEQAIKSYQEWKNKKL